MRKQKPRNALVSSDTGFIDLGVLNMTPTMATSRDDLEPEDDETEILDPHLWTTRNKIIVRGTQAL